MTTIYLIRHAEAEGNLYRRIHGWYDALVTENGLRQIQALAHRLHGERIDAAYSSDLYRTQATAQAVTAPRGLPLRLHPGLREVNMGAWEDRTWGDVRRWDGERLLQFNHSDPAWQAPSGESLGQVGRRCAAALEEIARSHPDQTVAVFSHGTAIRQALAHIRRAEPKDWPGLPHSDNTAVTCLAWDGAAFHVIYQGDNSHLDESLSTLARQSWWRKGPNKGEDVNFWFRPLDPKGDRDWYLSLRQEIWTSAWGEELPFDGEALWASAAARPEDCFLAMSGEQPAGVVQCSPTRYQAEGAAFLSFAAMAPGLRGKGLGAQLLGQAVSHSRRLGLTALRVRCSSRSREALAFFAKHGFSTQGEDQLGQQSVLLLQRSITQPPLPQIT